MHWSVMAVINECPRICMLNKVPLMKGQNSQLPASQNLYLFFPAVLKTLFPFKLALELVFTTSREGLI